MKIIFLNILLSLSINLLAQNNVRLKIALKDSLDYEPIENLRIKVNDNIQLTNSDGLCVFNINKGYCNIQVFKFDTALLYSTSIQLFSDTFITIKLTGKIKDFTTFILRNKVPIFQNDEGRLTIQNSILKNTPLPMSTNDPIHLLKLFPGVTTTQEMNSSLSFRGSNPYNSCVYLDGIPVPNLSHSFGLFSFFDTKNIRSIDYYNFNISSEFGGRGSSYLKFFLNDPSLSKTKFDLSLTPFLISGNFNTKLIKDRLGIYVYYRKSILSSAYNDLIPLFSRFNDFTFKTKYRINDKSDLIFTGIRSIDRINTNFGFGLDINDSSIWVFNGYGLQYIYNNSTISYINSTYFRSQELKSYNDGVLNSSSYGLDEFNNKQLIKFTPYKFINSAAGAEFGINRIRRADTPENALFTSRNTYLTLFADVKLIHKKFSAFTNIRLNKLNNIKSVLTENRVGISYKYKFSSIRLEYNEFLNLRHVLSKNLLPTSFDFQLLADNRFLPNKVKELITGYNYNSKRYDFSVNLFKRWYENTFDYIKLSLDNPNLPSNIIMVNQTSYGVELLSNYNFGNNNRLTTSYTFSRSFLQNDSVNLGLKYVANYDRPHNLNVLFNKKIGRVNIFSNFNLQSGRPITKPLFIAYQQVPIFSKRNEFRLPTYHRLDIGMKYDFKKSKKFSSSLSFHLYNVYFRKNIYGMIWTKDENTGIYSVYYLSTFPFLPSFNYSISF